MIILFVHSLYAQVLLPFWTLGLWQERNIIHFRNFVLTDRSSFHQSALDGIEARGIFDHKYDHKGSLRQKNESVLVKLLQLKENVEVW